MSGPGSVTRVFHFTAVVADRDETVDALSRLFGARVLHTASGDMFGVVMHRAMLWIGDNLLEVIQPVGDSPFQGFLDRFGGGLNSLGLEVADADAAAAHLDAHGIGVAVRFGPDMFATRTSGTAGLALQFTSQTVADDPRRMAVPPAPPSDAVVTVERLAFAAALVSDPAAGANDLARALGTDATTISNPPLGAGDLARALGTDATTIDDPPLGADHLGRALGTDASTTNDPSSGADDVDRALDSGATAGAPGPRPGPEATVGLGDCSLALYRLSDADDPAIWGASHSRPRLLAFGLQVPDTARALAALAAQGIGVASRHTVGALLDPAATPIPIIICDRLPPGDPRHRGRSPLNPREVQP